MSTLEPPHTNGAVSTSRRSPLRKWIAIVVGVVVLGLWAWGITYSVTTGGRSPERLDDATARAVETQCLDAQHDLEALSQLGPHATLVQRAARVTDEDQVFTTMINRLRRLRPDSATPATALTAWLDDWQHMVTARENYARDLHTKGNAARFIEPASGGAPIANRMNNWPLEQGTRTDACNTGVLQAEVIEGPRAYGPGSKT